jgi:hypothetical protein
VLGHGLLRQSAKGEDGWPDETGCESLVKDAESVRDSGKRKIGGFRFIAVDDAIKAVRTQDGFQLGDAVAPVHSGEYILLFPVVLDD